MDKKEFWAVHDLLDVPKDRVKVVEKPPAEELVEEDEPSPMELESLEGLAEDEEED